MEKYFEIKYHFDKESVRKQIHQMVKSERTGYVCVADGVTMAMAQEDSQLKAILDEASIVTCDSGWVPLYLRLLYGIRNEQYSGTELMGDIVNEKAYQMMFLGSTGIIRQALKKKLAHIDSRINNMLFVELPFCNFEDFDYEEIANNINKENPDIIWISLGMPKQELFMHRIKPLLNRGVLIGVGAAFKFHSGLEELKRAPEWMIRYKLEWLHRIWSEPGKQLSRCWLIIRTMPSAFINEYKSKKNHEY